ncbi:hypothetical protein KC19_VG040100 [Ceratodon purpureus]|uniref:Uncharacterized protein n=1 Tax=Ceratodon purpureus TaxID=3225 RepID=A0A8T0HLN5_CERPU|nr:hypothetical protein KC19_VG040100 [Ceratodon purpureus]
MEPGLGFLGSMLLANGPPPLVTPASVLSSTCMTVVSSTPPPPLSLEKNWSAGATKLLQIVLQFPKEASRTWIHVRDKWDKLRRHY